MTKPAPPQPTDITLHAASRVLEIAYDDGQTFRLPFEFLRVYSPSAEVRGHGPGQETLQVGQRDVTIMRLDPVGYYAVQPVFSDGHTSGIFSWTYLYELGREQERLWAEYLAQLDAAGTPALVIDLRGANGASLNATGKGYGLANRIWTPEFTVSRQPEAGSITYRATPANRQWFVDTLGRMQAETPMLILGSVVGLVLLIACANIAKPISAASSRLRVIAAVITTPSDQLS